MIVILDEAVVLKKMVTDQHLSARKFSLMNALVIMSAAVHNSAETQCIWKMYHVLAWRVCLSSFLVVLILNIWL